MKKLMAILTILSVFAPFASVKAEGEIITDCSVNSSCFVYTPGDEVNFYRSEDERKLNSKEAGQTTIILEDVGAASKYVKVLALSPYSTTVPYFDKKVETVPTTDVKRDHLSYINKGEFIWESAKHDAQGNMEMEYITLDQLVKVFGATQKADKTYTIDATKWGKTFMTIVEGAIAVEEATGKTDVATNNAIKKGFYTGEYDLTTNKVWAVEYTLNATQDAITAITVKQVDMNTNTYAYLPVVSFDKTYDCHSRVANVEMNCYSCDDDYKWLQAGTQAETCTLVPNITSKGTCVKAVKTGVEDYFLEFVGIAAVCGVALIIAKKKDLFRSI